MRRLSQVLIGALLGGLITQAGAGEDGPRVADEELLEFLGSWDIDDEDWTLFVDIAGDELLIDEPLLADTDAEQ